MSLIAFTSAKSSPGTTATALAAACCWPEEVLLVEADPAGGDLVARSGLASQPGLATLAAASRRSLTPGLVRQHAQLLRDTPVLVAPPARAAAGAALTTLAGSLADHPVELGCDLLVDCGRLEASSQGHRLLASADLVAVAARPTLEEVPRVREVSSQLRASGSRVGLVLVGEPSRECYPAGEVAEVTGAEVLATLASDPVGARMLFDPKARTRALDRTALLRSARTLVETLRGAVVGAPPPEVARLPPEAPSIEGAVAEGPERPPARMRARRAVAR